MPKFGPDQLGQSYQLQLPENTVAFDADAFDGLIRSQGVQMIHFRSMRCPVGLGDPDDIRQTHEHHENCSNGMVYTKSGCVTVGFLGNSGSHQFTDMGRQDGSTVTVVLPRFYDDPTEERVDVTYMDRFYLKEEGITVTTTFTFATHITGVDRLCFPAVKVIDLIDSRGKRYAEGIDFVVRGGQIHWNDGMSPGVDPASGKGTVCSVRFAFRPFWYVKALPHEVRVSQTEDEYFKRTTQQMPKQVVLQREMHFEKAQRDELAKDPEKRQHKAPADGSFGPR